MQLCSGADQSSSSVLPKQKCWQVGTSAAQATQPAPQSSTGGRTKAVMQKSKVQAELCCPRQEQHPTCEAKCACLHPASCAEVTIWPASRRHRPAHLVVGLPHPKDSISPRGDILCVWPLCHHHEVLCAVRTPKEVLHPAPAAVRTGVMWVTGGHGLLGMQCCKACRSFSSQRC